MKLSVTKLESEIMKYDRSSCPSCPAALVCASHKLVVINQCTKCERLIAYFTNGEAFPTQAVISSCSMYPAKRIHSCKACADGYPGGEIKQTTFEKEP